MFSQQVVIDLLQTSASQLQELTKAYERLPITRCRRQARCCSTLPEMTLIETLPIIQCLMNMSSDDRQLVLQKTIGYFFLNPVEILSCPFLSERHCRIYRHRAFGCRAYGLWSPSYYAKLARQQRRAKKHLRQQWKHLGISLPEKVLAFEVPYCRWVETDATARLSDEALVQVAAEIETMSQSLSVWQQTFAERFFGDLSFFLAAIIYGTSEAVRLKFKLVKDIVATGEKKTFDAVIEELPDPFEKIKSCQDVT